MWRPLQAPRGKPWVASQAAWVRPPPPSGGHSRVVEKAPPNATRGRVKRSPPALLAAHRTTGWRRAPRRALKGGIPRVPPLEVLRLSARTRSCVRQHAQPWLHLSECDCGRACTSTHSPNHARTSNHNPVRLRVHGPIHPRTLPLLRRLLLSAFKHFLSTRL